MWLGPVLFSFFVTRLGLANSVNSGISALSGASNTVIK